MCKQEILRSINNYPELSMQANKLYGICLQSVVFIDNNKNNEKVEEQQYTSLYS